MTGEKAIGFEIKTVSNLIKRRINNSIAEHRDIDQSTAMHGWVLGYLCHHQDRDIFQKDLEQQFSIRRSTATEILKLMEKKGLIERKPVSYDARLKKIVLTEKAVQTHAMIQQEIDKMDNELKACLTEAEVSEFFKIMDKIKTYLLA